MSIIKLGNIFSTIEGDFDRNLFKEKLTFISKSDQKYFFIQRKKFVDSFINKRAIGFKRKFNGIPVPHDTIKQWQYQANDRFNSMVESGYITKPREKCLFENDTFPTGLLEYVVENCVLEDFEIFDERYDNGIDLDLPEPFLDTFSEREYQQDAVRMAKKYKNGVIQIGCGGGKSIVILHLIHQFGKKFIYVTRNNDLVHQIANQIYLFYTGESMFDKFPQLKNYKNASLDAQINKILQKELGIGVKDFGKNGILTTIFSFYKFSHDPDIGVILFDECQFAPTNTALKGLSTCNARVRIGLSASPEGRSDEMDILTTAFLGNTLYYKNHSDLVSDNYVCKIKVYMYTFDHQYQNEHLEKPWELYANQIVYNEARNRLIASLLYKYATDNAIIAFVKQIEHGKIIEKMVKNLGGDAYFFDAGSRGEKLQNLLKNPKGKIIIATGFLDTGVDCPELNVGMLCGAGRSKIFSGIQTPGRLVRLHPSKNDNTVIFLDIYDTNHKVFASQAKSRKKLYQEMRYEINMISANKQDMLNILY